MRYILFVTLVFLMSCKEDEPSFVENPPLDEPMYAYINDEPWVPNAVRAASLSDQQLSIGAADAIDPEGIKRIVYISLDTPQIGTLHLTPGGTNLIRYSEFKNGNGFTVDIQEGTITLSKLDINSKKVSGTFSAYYNVNGVRVSITDGAFTDINLHDLFCSVSYVPQAEELTLYNTWNLVGFMKASSPGNVFDPPCDATIQITFDSTDVSESDTLRLHGKAVSNTFSSFYQVTNDSTITTMSLDTAQISTTGSGQDYLLWFFQSIESRSINYYIEDNTLKLVYNDRGDSMLFYRKDD
jgi:hypothetical protein